MQLARFARRRYTQGHTPIQRLARLERELGGPKIFIKRDDLSGLAPGGNKTRKLEFLVAEALSRRADTLITEGAVQSNHCRLTLAAANLEGLACRLLLEERVPGSHRPDATGNFFLYQLLGAQEIRVVRSGADLSEAREEMVANARAEGRTPYLIPGGGSSPLGALGYAACAQEVLAQAFELGHDFTHVVLASGSGGTHAGLVAGLRLANASVPVIGVSVSAASNAQQVKVWRLATEVAALLGAHNSVEREAVTVLDEYLGEGYGMPTREMAEAVRLFARLEGILLDPVYTGKAAAGLIDMVRRGRFNEQDKVLFVHTGGVPALFAYQNDVLGA